MKKIIFAIALVCAMTACSSNKPVSISEDTVVDTSFVDTADICEVDTVL